QKQPADLTENMRIGKELELGRIHRLSVFGSSVTGAVGHPLSMVKNSREGRKARKGRFRDRVTPVSSSSFSPVFLPLAFIGDPGFQAANHVPRIRMGNGGRQRAFLSPAGDRKT